MKQKLVLIGGGHAHAIALKQWGLNPLPDVDLILVSDVEQTPYSGMLPGHVAGFYSYAETHIDLRNLAGFAEAEFIGDRAVGIDLEHNQLICTSNSLRFDYLSCDLGSTPQMQNVPGAKEFTVAAKPVPIFLDAWHKLKHLAAANPDQPLSIAIIGGGAGGVELALNMQTCLGKILNEKNTPEIHLIHRGRQLLSSHNDWVSHKLAKIMQQRGIKLHLEQKVQAVFADRLVCQSGLKIETSHSFWVTQATAPSWIKESGLKTDDQGFILVENTLQSISHPHIFAAGDIATMINHQRPKAGVFAVRQGLPLWRNWQQIVTQQPLENYLPQDKYLALIGTGDRQAIASWDSWGGYSPIFWWLKDYIDRQFIRQFHDLI